MRKPPYGETAIDAARLDEFRASVLWSVRAQQLARPVLEISPYELIERMRRSREFRAAMINLCKMLLIDINADELRESTSRIAAHRIGYALRADPTYDGWGFWANPLELSAIPVVAGIGAAEINAARVEHKMVRE